MNDQNMVTPWDALSQITGVTAISNSGSHDQFHARGAAAWTLYGRVNRRNQDFLFHDSFPLSGVDRATQAMTYERREFSYDYTSDTADAYLNGRFRAFASTHDWLVGANFARFDSVGRRELLR